MGIQDRVLSYLKEEIDKENAKVLMEFRSSVNMSYRDLKDFLNSSRFLNSSYSDSGSIPDISRAVLRISNKEDSVLTENDFDWMRIINQEVKKIRIDEKLKNKSLKLKSFGIDESKG